MRHRISILSLLLILIVSMINVSAQAPYKFTFQGIALDDALQPVQNASIAARITIIQHDPLGAAVFEEIHAAQTASNGLFTVVVGMAGGDLSLIDWPHDTFFLKAEIDITNNGKFHFIGMSQLLSVPYSLYSNESGKWKDGDPILQKGNLDAGQPLPPVGTGTRLIWHPGNGAFRAGLNVSAWEEADLGKGSMAAGLNCKASGDFSVALGDRSTAIGDYAFSVGSISQSLGESSVSMGFSATAQQMHSLAFGHTAYAYNPFSIAIGYKTAAMGDHAVALGHHTVAKANYGIALGLFNNNFDQPSGGLTDRLFQIGNGTDINNRTNAVTVLRNGNVGIGGKVVAPDFILDVASRMRIRHSGVTAGLYLNNSQNNPEGFMGMKADGQIGFFLNGAWRFWIDDKGFAWTPFGQLGFSSSDKRLKKNIRPIRGSLSAISRLQGYHYHWIDTQRGADLQTGVIAQEVEEYFPELIQSDQKGFKTVNYIGLIPHLIEAVKELKSQTGEIAALKKELNEFKSLISRIPDCNNTIKKVSAGK